MKHPAFLKRLLSALTALVTAFTIITCCGPTVRLEASSQEELEQKLKDIDKKISASKDKIKDTEKDIEKEEENRDAIREQIDSTEEYINTLIELIEDYDTQIESLENEISILEGEIEIQKIRISDKHDEIEKNTYLYGERLRAMYLSGNDSVASILMGSSNFFDMLMRLEWVKRVADYDANLIDRLTEMKEEYEAQQLQLENNMAALEETVEITEGKKAEQENLKAEADDRLEELNRLCRESEGVIEQLEGLVDDFNDDIETYKKQQDEIEEEIQEIIRAKSRAQYMGDLPEGTFLWPAPGNQVISSPYGRRDGESHKGIDIRAGKGDDITAANSGIVIKVNNSCTHNYGKHGSCGCGGGFGNYCIIDHGGGYSTLYGHATKITVKEGDHVTTGDVIGYVGSTGWSTGYHLHFEIRVNGERLNPESFDLLRY